jgi:allantoate deiminase
MSSQTRAAEAIAECRSLATISEEPGRITRRFLTPPVAQIHQHLRQRMERLGMQVTLDAAGNLHGLWQPAGASKRIAIGSHIDTVPDAGPFDGLLGIILALHLVADAHTNSVPIAIEVIAFSEEEGVRFGVPFLGSRAVAGRFDPALLELTDPAGISIRQAISDFGLDPAEIDDALISEDAVGFLELHIEQGPVLDSELLSVAVVSGIVGQTRCELTFSGQANHAGTTPMALRQDALAAAAEWIVFVEAFASETEELTATVGSITASPNTGNVIPGFVVVSLDVRHARDSVRQEAVESLLNQAQCIASRRRINSESRYLMEQPAVPMDEELTALLAESIEAAGLPERRIASGAGHDAMVMATRLPTAMLFLRSPGGVSHHPAETVLESDVETALVVGSLFLRRLSARHAQKTLL